MLKHCPGRGSRQDGAPLLSGPSQDLLHMGLAWQAPHGFEIAVGPL